MGLIYLAHPSSVIARSVTIRNCFQPEGLSESSRWSKRSENHRYRLTNLIAPRRGATCENRREVFVVRDWDLAPLRGAISYYLLPVVFAALLTTGYSLATLRVALR